MERSQQSTAFTSSTLRNKPLPADDLRRVVEQVGDAWGILHRKCVVIIGSNGFVGRWMRESFFASPLWEANGSNHWNFHIVDRDVEQWWPSQKPDYVIHATTDGVGWQHVAAIARAAGARMLLLSSGAVYAPQPAGWTYKPIDEDWYDIPITKYGVEKKSQEQECQDVAVIARLFSFIGPGLRRHTGREFLEADPITVNDDGAVRSYLYASDMAAACWLALLRGQVGRAYNIGSPVPTKIADFARMCAHKRGVEISKVNASGGTYYVPDTSRAESELGFSQTIRIDDAIERTLAWIRF